MTKCRDAVRDKNWTLLRVLTQGVAAKAKRVAEVGRMAADHAREPWKKNTITATVTRLENGNHIHSLMLVRVALSLVPRLHPQT